MKLIILDRDGVINHDSPNYIKSPDEWQPLPKSLDAIAILKQAGFTIAVASNQSGIARGYYTHEMLEAIHQKMQAMLAAIGTQVDSIHYCPHLPDEGCTCRKPKPGLLHEIAEYYQIDLKGVPFVGDRASDVVAASKVGAKAIWVSTGYTDEATRIKQIDYPVTRFDDLYAVALALSGHA